MRNYVINNSTDSESVKTPIHLIRYSMNEFAIIISVQSVLTNKVAFSRSLVCLRQSLVSLTII